MESNLPVLGNMDDKAAGFVADESTLQLQGTFSPFLREVVLLAASSLETAYCSVSESTGDVQTLRMCIFSSRQGVDATAARVLNIPRARTLAGYALQTGNATLSPDIRRDPRFEDRVLTELGVASALALPLVHEEQHLGTLGFYRTEVKPFPLDQVCFVERLLNTLRSFLHELDCAAGVGPRKRHTQTLKQDWPSGQELRGGPRHRYNFAQSVAPVVDEIMPQIDDFFPVECRDVSSGGMAFVTPRKLPSDRVVVTLGRGQSCAHLMAQITHVTEVATAAGQAYQYGCKFLQRIYL